MGAVESQPKQDFFDHYSPNLSEIQTYIRIDAMTESEKLYWLSEQILKEEHRLLRDQTNQSQIRPEAKIMFLTGGPKSDVTQARDFEGNLVHTRQLHHPRPMFAEIPEALSSISQWFDLLSQSRENNTPPPSCVHAISEIADVVYNVSHLLTLDRAFTKEYNSYLSQIAASLGFSLNQLLTVAVYKYNFRLGQGKSQKNHSIEHDLIQRVLEGVGNDGKRLFPIPDETQFQKTFHTLSEIQTLLNTRLAQLRQEYEWSQNPL